MQYIISYIFRKKQSGYNSIENLFSNIQSSVSKNYNTNSLNLNYKGASPIIVLKNWLSFTNTKNSIYHITGDVHYMALVTGKNTVLTIHDIGSALNGNLFKQLIVKIFWFWLPALFVKRITVISKFTKHELEKIIPFSKSKIEVIPNPIGEGFKFSPYEFNTKRPVVLCIGTKANKNLERIIEAINNLDCKLLIIGYLTSSQLKLLKSYNIKYSNVFNLTQEEIIKAYQDSDMLCFPSTYEGFGMPIIEAQATGRPVITSNFGAMLEVAKDSACLVDSYNTNEIRKAIQKIISDDSYRNDLIKKGLNNIQRFQLKAIVNQYITIYRELGL